MSCTDLKATLDLPLAILRYLQQKRIDCQSHSGSYPRSAFSGHVVEEYPVPPSPLTRPLQNPAFLTAVCHMAPLLKGYDMPRSGPM